MSQSAFHTSAGNFLDSYDFNQNYKYLKKLIQDLKVENGSSLRKELFGEDESGRTLSKREMKALFRFLRKIESHYEECCTPPIPEELEQSIRQKAKAAWLPWESEAIHKVDEWRSALVDRKLNARDMLGDALERVRRGESV
jgi:hypothetical protein